jgi:hypothetical protein
VNVILRAAESPKVRPPLRDYSSKDEENSVKDLLTMTLPHEDIPQKKTRKELPIGAAQRRASEGFLRTLSE